MVVLKIYHDTDQPPSLPTTGRSSLVRPPGGQRVGAGGPGRGVRWGWVLAMRLTKTDFIHYLKCPKSLWLKKRELGIDASELEDFN